MAAKFCHQLFGTFFMFLVLQQSFVVKSRPVKLESLQSHKGDVVNGELRKPRCGIPDNVTEVTNDYNRDTLVSEYSFFNGNPRWRTPRLTYGFRSNLELPAGMDFQVMRGVMQRAFRTWSAAVPQFTFQELAQGDTANIKIAFIQMGTTLGLGYAPQDGSLYYNLNVNWSTNSVPARNQIDLESVALHEIGHGLGLGHSEFSNAVMFASIPFGVSKRVLTQDDIIGLRALYGY